MNLQSIALRAKRARDVLHQETRIFRRRPQWTKLDWMPVPSAPLPRVEAASVQLGHLLYVMGGYHTLDDVLSVIDVYDLEASAWVEQIRMPETVAQTHRAVAAEADRYIYYISGQVGPQCSPATDACHVFDAQTREWTSLPPLPRPRYAPVAEFWKGRLHVLGGSREDRCPPADEHWSIAVENGRALEATWREEPPIPLAGTHRSAGVVGDRLFVLGSLHFDRPAVKGDPNFTCDWGARDEVLYTDCYCLTHGASAWTRIADMPIPAVHCEFSTFVDGARIFILGGMTTGMILSDLIQVYDTTKDAWSIVGRLPTRNKGFVAGFHDGWLHVLTGQRNRRRFDATYGDVIAEGFRARFNPRAALA